MKPFLRLLTTEQAYEQLALVEPLGTETVSSRACLGRVLAEPVTAREDVPHFFRSNMDGFAVRAQDTYAASDTSSVALELIGEVAMGALAVEPIRPGCALRVSTGAMMPPGADAVVLVEHTEEIGGRILIRSAVVPGASTIAIGEDLRCGDPVLEAGHRIRGSDVGVITGVGRSHVVVRKVPRVGVAATGDEIVEPEDELPPGRVRNVNQYLLASMARSLGASVTDYGVVRDDEAALRSLLERARAECDVLIVSGGSSMGSKDLVLGSVSGAEQAQVVFHGIAIAPGKPTMLARIGPLAILGVPGNPSAAAVVFTLFGSTLIRVREGEPLARILARRPRVRARLTENLSSTPGREDYVRVRLEQAGDDELLRARPLRGKSVTISTIARADALLRIPRSSEGLSAGTEVEVLLF
ncbi:MAG TPA: gephyrin-like molybdotransferase Glp [Candidatus Limnocylindrales bacterium]|nr:gephyrin-like molybdotransferase Glp [Candidatus Limnocylindrales bacterium]